MSKNPLIKSFPIHQGDVISIVGAGGKTSLLYYLAEHLTGHRLLMPSTKILKPVVPWPCYIDQTIKWSALDEIVLGANQLLHNNKLSGINRHYKATQWDWLLIEADGSRTLPLKGWGEDEPVIMPDTTVTIGIIDITTLGMPINGDTVYRYDALSLLTEANEQVTYQTLCDIVTHRNGLFRKSIGKRCLLINKCETPKARQDALALLELITTYPSPAHPIDYVIVGSVKEGMSYETYRGIP